MNEDIDKMVELIEALEEHYPYDRRVGKFKTDIGWIKKKFDYLHNRVYEFMKQEGIHHDEG